ncbi:MAG: hypothetical protein RR359_02825 [Bacilli bacterium]
MNKLYKYSRNLIAIKKNKNSINRYVYNYLNNYIEKYNKITSNCISDIPYFKIELVFKPFSNDLACCVTEHEADTMIYVGTRCIEVNLLAFVKYDIDTIDDMLKHELCHYIQFENNGFNYLDSLTDSHLKEGFLNACKVLNVRNSSPYLNYVFNKNGGVLYENISRIL